MKSSLRLFQFHSLSPICLLSVGLLLSPNLWAKPTPSLEFQRYAVKPQQVKPQAIRIEGTNKRYKTLLTELKSQPINYAGHYVLSTYGCGGGCQGIAVYNAKTGSAFIHPEHFSECYSEKYGWRDRDYDMKINSRLLILTGSRHGNIAHCEKVYYLIEGNRFKEIAQQNLFTK